MLANHAITPNSAIDYLQAGLIDHWKQKTWARMKVEQYTGMV